jgi:hypothetical protein
MGLAVAMEELAMGLVVAMEKLAVEELARGVRRAAGTPVGKKVEKVTVGVSPILLGEMQLSYYLREDGGDISDHHKNRMVKGSCWSIESGLSFSIC